MVAVAAAVCSAISLAAAAASWVVAFIHTDDDAFRLAVGLTTLGSVLGLVYTVIQFLTRVEECHDETRKHIKASADRVIQVVADKVTLQMYDVFANTIAEQIDAAERLSTAQRRWRALVGTDTPVDLHTWRAGRAADGAAQH